MQNWRETVVSQYANSPLTLRLIGMFDQWCDPKADFDAFYKSVWNIDSATGYGLDVWGRIVGVSRVVQIPSTAKNFGFATPNKDFVGFNQHGSFYIGGQKLTQNYSLADDAFRTYILFKAAANISNCSATSMNKLFSALFADRGRVYVQKTGTMSIAYIFNFVLRVYELAILKNSDAVIRPTGVMVTIEQQSPGGYFGFKQMKAGARPFNVKPFRTNDGA